MEYLDRENDQETCEYTLVGGSSSNRLLERCPSTLMVSSPSKPHPSAAEKCPRCQLRKKKRSTLGSSSSAEDSRPSSSLGSVMSWDEEDVMAWLRETGLEMYEVRMIICCGKP